MYLPKHTGSGSQQSGNGVIPQAGFWIKAGLNQRGFVTCKSENGVRLCCYTWLLYVPTWTPRVQAPNKAETALYNAQGVVNFKSWPFSDLQFFPSSFFLFVPIFFHWFLGRRHQTPRQSKLLSADVSVWKTWNAYRSFPSEVFAAQTFLSTLNCLCVSASCYVMTGAARNVKMNLLLG